MARIFLIGGRVGCWAPWNATVRLRFPPPGAVLVSDSEGPAASTPTECEEEDDPGLWEITDWEGQLLPPRPPKGGLPAVATAVETLLQNRPPPRPDRARMQKKAGEPGPDKRKSKKKKKTTKKRKGRASFWRGSKKCLPQGIPPPLAGSPAPAVAAPKTPEPPAAPRPAAAPAAKPPRKRKSGGSPIEKRFGLPGGLLQEPHPGEAWTLLQLQAEGRAHAKPLSQTPHTTHPGMCASIRRPGSTRIAGMPSHRQAHAHSGAGEAPAPAGRPKGRRPREWPHVPECPTAPAAAVGGAGPAATEEAGARSGQPASAPGPSPGTPPPAPGRKPKAKGAKAPAAKDPAAPPPDELPIPEEMPPEALPQGRRGRLSYTVSRGQARVEVLLAGRAFKVKCWGEREAPGKHVPWMVYGGPAGAWRHLLQQGLQWA